MREELRRFVFAVAVWAGFGISLRCSATIALWARLASIADIWLTIPLRAPMSFHGDSPQSSSWAKVLDVISYDGS